MIDPACLPELERATPEQLSQVEILPGVGMSELGKRGRGRTSEARARAARQNGACGGRPRKSSSRRGPVSSRY